MKYILLFAIMLPIFMFSQNKSKKKECNCSVVLFNKEQKVPVLDNNKKVICYIINDTITEDYYGIIISKIKHGYAFANASATLYDTTPKIGWIKTRYLGIYPSNFSTINLYCNPNIESKVRSQILKPEYYPFNIINCKDNWLYVKYLDFDGKIKEGWLSPKDQCSNPYSTCN